MPAGGKRLGAGRKSLSDETEVRDAARNAIIGKYGSIKDGLLNILQSDSDTLKKFVWEHALGKAPDKIQMSTDPDQQPIIQINVVRTQKEVEGDGPDDEVNTDSL